MKHGACFGGLFSLGVAGCRCRVCQAQGRWESNKCHSLCRDQPGLVRMDCRKSSGESVRVVMGLVWIQCQEL